MDYNVTVFRGNKILFSSIIIDIFSLLWTLTTKTIIDFFHFTEMRISTHMKSFLCFKLSWLRWLLVVQLNFFLTLTFLLLFFILLKITPPSVCPFTTNPLHPNVTGSDGLGSGVGGGSDGGFRWGGGVGFRWGVGSGGGWVQMGGLGSGGDGFRWGGWVQAEMDSDGGWVQVGVYSDGGGVQVGGGVCWFRWGGGLFRRGVFRWGVQRGGGGGE